MILKRAIAGALLGLTTLALLPQTALAEHGGYGERGYGWHGDIRHFRDRDFQRWRGGHWMHGRHDGYLGWWWVVGGLWYFYADPVYPYPDPYVPPSSGTQYWYYCEPAGAYYPYVATCPSGWRKVPAAPPNAPK